MATQTERKSNNSALLSQIYEQQPLAFQQRCQKKLGKYKQDIITKWKNEITEQQFIQYLNGKISSSLAKIIFQMIYSNPTSQIKPNHINKSKILIVTKANIIQFISNDINNNNNNNNNNNIEKPKSQTTQKKDKNKDVDKDVDVDKEMDKNKKEYTLSLNNEIFAISISLKIKDFIEWIKIKNT